MFNVPWSVTASVAVLALIHVVQVMLPDEAQLRLIFTLAFIPARYAAETPPLPGGEVAGVTSFVTYMLLHGDLTHLLINTVWLLAFGSAVAKRIGDRRFFTFSCLCGIAGALTHLVFHLGQMTPVIGASAAISGQMAGAMRFVFAASNSRRFRLDRDFSAVPLATLRETFTDSRILIFLAVWAVLNVVFGIGVLGVTGEGQSIAWEAHLGGFAAGLLTFGLFDRTSRDASIAHTP